MAPAHVTSQTLTYTIGSVDASAYVQASNAPQFESNLADSLDTFKVTTYDPLQTWAPAIWDDFVVTAGDDTIFGGKITKITKILVHQHIAYQVYAADWGIVFAKTTVNGVWRSTTVEGYWESTETVPQTDSTLLQAIIASVLPDYDVTTFVQPGVLNIPRAAYSRRSLKSVVDQVCAASGCSWYVDANKAFHYFHSYEEDASFGLSDAPDDATTFGFAEGSLSVDLDGDDIRNRVFVYGGMQTLPTATINYSNLFQDWEVLGITGDGTTRAWKTPYRVYKAWKDQIWLYDTSSSLWLLFPLGTVGGGAGTAPRANYDYTNSVVVIDNPVLPQIINAGILAYKYQTPVVVRRSDHVSYETFGSTWFDYVIRDETISSTAAAVLRADTVLTEYANERILGRVRCYKAGLKAGQKLRVTCSELGIDNDYLIQSVKMTAYGLTYYEYEVEFGAWNPTLVEYLQALYRTSESSTDEDWVSDEESVRDYLTLQGTLALAGTASISGTINIAKWDEFRWGFAAWE